MVINGEFGYKMKELTIIMPVLWFDETTGGWTHFKEMASRLSLSGIKILVFSPRAVCGKRIETMGNITIYRYSSIYLPQIPLLIFNPIDFIKTLTRVSSEVSSIDLIYDTTSGLLPVSPIIKLFFRLRGLKLPLVISILGELKEMESKGFLSLLFEFYLNIVARFSFSLSDKILLAGAKIVPRALSLGANPKKMEIARVGLKYEKNLTAQHILDEAEKAKLKASIGINQNDFVIGFVGRLSVGKGLDVLLNSVALVKVIIPQIKVLIVGDGGERNHLSIPSIRIGYRGCYNIPWSQRRCSRFTSINEYFCQPIKIRSRNIWVSTRGDANWFVLYNHTFFKFFS